ncbi:MAG: hypothetical protein FD180_2365 [Planctomycetota bacterium]|nr:MAG: hypothetical protein FD180_2365 [Planctomycetota bacterium]
MKPVVALLLALVLSATASAQTRLEVRFLDDVKPLSVGKDIRFEVIADLGGGKTSKMAIDQLEFSQQPEGWASIMPSDDPAVGVITVRKISGGGVFDEAEYTIRAAIKGEGSGKIRSKSRFRMETGLPLVPLNMFYSWDGANWKTFDAATLSQLDARKNFTTSNKSALEVVKLDGVFYAKWLSEAKNPVDVTVTFPNGEKASLTLEFQGTKKAAETTPPPDNPQPSSGTMAADIEKLLKEIHDSIDLLTSYEGKSFMLADTRRKWIVDGLKRSKRMIGEFSGEEAEDFSQRHNELLERAFSERVRYREAGSGGNVPAKELEIVSSNEKDVLRVK